MNLTFIFRSLKSGTFCDDWSPREPLKGTQLTAAHYVVCTTSLPVMANKLHHYTACPAGKPGGGLKVPKCFAPSQNMGTASFMHRLTDEKQSAWNCDRGVFDIAHLLTKPTLVDWQLVTEIKQLIQYRPHGRQKRYPVPFPGAYLPTALAGKVKQLVASVRPSICFHSIHLLNSSFCMCMGHDLSLPETESQGQG